MRKYLSWAFAGALLVALPIYAWAQGSSTSPLLNELATAFSPNEQNQSADITTATTSDLIPILDVSETPDGLNYGDGANILEMIGTTSTAAELTILDGVTSTAAELNILDGVTSTAAELNILDGVTAVAAEINMAADISANTEIVTTTNVIAAAESGTTYVLNTGTAFVTTLPAPAAGLRFTFIVGATIVTGGNHTIVTNASGNVVYGNINVAGAVVLASAEDSINLVADLTLPGDILYVFSDGTNWYVSGMSSTASGITFTAT